METTEKKIYTLENNYAEIEAFFKTKPHFRIYEHCNKFFIQILTPIVKKEYDSLEDAIAYQTIKDEYITNNCFHSLEDAVEMLKKYVTKARAHILPDGLITPNELPTEQYRILEYIEKFWIQEYFEQKDLTGYKNLVDEAMEQPYGSLEEATSALEEYLKDEIIHDITL
jgi:hypothetical protein